MTPPVLRSRFQRVPHVALALSALLLIASGCEKLVGISDTEVTRDGSGGGAAVGADASGAGNAGMSSAGSHAGGAANAGATGSDAGSPEMETGGTSGNAGASGALGTAGKAAAGGGSGSAGSSGASGTAAMGGSGGAASECPCAAPTPTCENNKCVVRGPTMIEVTDATPPYYIDSTEVTVAQYKTFIATNPPTTGQRAACAWNKSYAPDTPYGGATTGVVSVDFCDADAYCTWAGKQLCGAIGGGTLKGTDSTVDPNPDVVNIAKSQWYLACAGPQVTEYNYGNNESDTKCNESVDNDVEPVASFPGCVGHYNGLYDMVGNAIEWIDACDANTGEADNCAIIGGSYTVEPEGGCDDYDLTPRDSTGIALGFRCCSK